MINIRCFFLRLYLLTYSPIFPIVLGSMIFITYRIYFEPVLLCDYTNWTLCNLKLDLTNHVTSYRIADVHLQAEMDKLEQIRDMPRVTDDIIKEKNRSIVQLDHWINESRRTLTKVREVEYYVKRLEPSYKSVVDLEAQYRLVSRASWI
jgi:hypothetical protein